MASILTRSIMLIFVSACLQILSFPIAGAVPAWRVSLSFIALAPLLLAIGSSPSTTAKSAWIRGYLCGVLFYAGNCAWIYQTMYLYGGLPKPLALLILLLFSLYLGLYHALFALLFLLSTRSRCGVHLALVLAPFIWVTVELARARITGFPWDLLGNSQVDNFLLIRLAPLGGVMAISFVLVAINAVIVLAIFRRGKVRMQILSAAALVIAALQLGSHIFIPPVQYPEHVAIALQENLSVGAVGREDNHNSPAEDLADFSARTLRLAQSRQAPPAIVVWPEAPSHLQSRDPDFRIAMSSLAQSTQAPLIIGSLGVDESQASPRGYLLYDSASLFSASGSYQGRYDKIHLVPWGEYIPFKSFFAFAEKLTEGAGDMDRGTARTLFTSAGHTYGVFICYESIFGDEVRQFVLGGAQVLVNISDDGWYGDTGAPWQHLNMARMRAIENHRWVIRDTNTGITTSIDPWGRTIAAAPRHLRAAFALPFNFTPASTLTLYTRFGDWFAYLCATITLFTLLFVQLTRPRKIV